MKHFFDNISWQKKLFFFATIISVIPVLFVSNNIISLAKDELKSSTNSELISTANELADELNDFYKSLFENLRIIKNGLENKDLGQNEKISFLLAGIENVNNLLSIKIVIKENGNMIDAVEVRKDSLENLSVSSGDSINIYGFDNDTIKKAISENVSLTKPISVKDLEIWISDAILELDMGLRSKTYLLAKVNMSDFENKLIEHPFNLSGKIVLINKFAQTIFADKDSLINNEYLEDISGLLKTNKRLSGLNNFSDVEGQSYVACTAFPENLDWAIISIIEENKAYLPVDDMIVILRYWLIIGIAITLLGVILFSNVISKPINKMGQLAKKIAPATLT